MTPAKLKQFEVKGDGMEFTLSIEDESGHRIELSATRDQLDMIADSLDDLLLGDFSDEEE